VTHHKSSNNIFHFFILRDNENSALIRWPI
jgi:hypothetical protein